MEIVFICVDGMYKNTKYTYIYALYKVSEIWDGFAFIFYLFG